MIRPRSTARSRLLSHLVHLARLAALPGALLVAGCYGPLPSAQTPSLGQPVAATLTADDGAPSPIPAAGGKAMVLDFWSPSCEPCKRVIPAVLARRADIEKKGAVHVLVAVLEKGQSVNDARAALATWGINERFVVDEEGALLAKIGAPDVPAFAILDAAGVLHWVAPSGVTISNILDAIP